MHKSRFYYSEIIGKCIIVVGKTGTNSLRNGDLLNGHQQMMRSVREATIADCEFNGNAPKSLPIFGYRCATIKLLTQCYIFVYFMMNNRNNGNAMRCDKKKGTFVHDDSIECRHKINMEYTK